MKGFQFQKKDFNLLEEPGTLGISYGCPEDSLVSITPFVTKQQILTIDIAGSLSFTPNNGKTVFHQGNDHALTNWQRWRFVYVC